MNDRTMKKILFITEKFPYPLDSGGRIRTYHILKGLAKEYEVCLITSIEHNKQRDLLPELEKLCNEVYTVDTSPDGKLSLLLKILKNMCSSIPIVVGRHYIPGVAEKIRELAAKHNVVHFDHLDATIYMSEIPESAITVLDEHNIVTNQIKTCADIEKNPLKRLYMRLQQKKTESYEANICNQVSQCLVCSDTDNNYLKNLANKSIVVTVPNGVDVDYFTDESWSEGVTDSLPGAQQSVIFVGALDYGPGGAAVRYFYEDIFPRIRENYPEMQFVAVGQSPSAHLQSIARRDPNLILTGRVDDVRPYVARSKVFVVPLRSGSGTRLKILSAMAMGVPVVSTSIGAEGLNVTHGENILIADKAETFSEAVVQLLHNQGFADYVSQNARKLVEETYSWPVVWENLLYSYRRILSCAE